MADSTCAHERRRRLDLVWPALLPVVTLLALAPVASASVVLVDGRVALVGNRTPPHIGRLANSESYAADMAAALSTAGLDGAPPAGGALAIDERHPDRHGFQRQAAIRSWQSSSGAQAMGHPDRAGGTPAAVSPGYQAPSPRLAAFAAPAAQLPPEILVDRHLVRVDRLLADDDYGAALTVMDEIVELQRQHDLQLPEEFPFRYAEVAFAAGLAEPAIASLNEYLVAAGRDGDFYRQALLLLLLDTAEEALRRADAERRRADRERQRAEARQRAHDEHVERQLAAAERPLPRDTLRSGGLGPEMVTIARGRFQYNTYQGRSHLEWVVFDRPFAISKYEVTRGEFETFVDRARYRTEARRDPNYGCSSPDYFNTRRNTSLRWNRPGFDQTDRHPVACVSVRDAMAYARWLSEETGHSYRLPSAAEWQYAARAGSEEAQLHIAGTNRNSCGRANLAEISPAYANIRCQDQDGVRYTAEVGRFPPNRVGVHDMIGNVAELVLACGHRQPNDRLRLAPHGAPENPDGCSRYVAAMGGAWFGINATSMYYGTWQRLDAQPSRVRLRGEWRYRRNSTTWIGLRLVRDLPQ